MPVENPTAKDIFWKALELSAPADREAFLNRACHGDDELRLRVEKLLAAQLHSDSFLDSPVAQAFDPRTLVTTPGKLIGPYVIREQIGEGGMGEVFVAEQSEPVRRKVALKIIRPAMATKDVIARFEAERQALAMMDHSNIAHVFDGGTTDAGQPYFVMELVQGPPITEYCDAHRLTTCQRLELFLCVCRAVQHAHQKGIIHRDVKPSNVLVSEIDGAAVPKVIDFGVAKATDQKLTERTIYTQFSQMIGTPLYMSPEQAGMGVVDIDTRSDIYSLGVLLYELLTGSTPFDRDTLEKVGCDELRRMIREEDPPSPSGRISTLAAASLSTIADRRGVDPRKLSHTLHGELDWIIMKALEKDRTRRYETSAALAADIERFLKGEAVEACPPSAAYKFRKFARRNRGSLAAIAVVATVLLVASVISTSLAVWALRAEEDATREASKSDQVAAMLKDMLASVAPSVALGRDTELLKEMLDKTAERLDTDLKDQPEVESELRTTLGNVYRDLGDYAAAEAMHRRALTLRQRLFGEKHPQIVDSLNNLGYAIWLSVRSFADQAKYAETKELHAAALTMAKSLHGEKHIQVAQSKFHLGTSLHGLEEFAEAEELFRDVIAMQRRLLGHDHPDVAITLNCLADSLHHQVRCAESAEIHRETLELRRRILGEKHPDVAESLYFLGSEIGEQGNYAEAESLLRKALEMRLILFGQDHPDVDRTVYRLTDILEQQGKYAESEELIRRHLEIAMQEGEQHPKVAVWLTYLASALEWQHRDAEAEETLRRALAIATRKGEDNPHAAQFFLWLAEMLDRHGKTDKVEETALKALSLYATVYGEQSLYVANALATIANLQAKYGKDAQAEESYRKALAINRKILGENDSKTAGVKNRLARLLGRTGRIDEAIALQVEAADSANDWGLGGLALLWAGRHDEHAELSAKMLQMAEETGDSAQMDSAARCTLMNELCSPELVEQAAGLAERSLELVKDEALLAQQHKYCSVGMAKYRQGSYAEAEKALAKTAEADDLDLRVNATAFFAMTVFRRNDVDEACERLARAEQDLGLLAVFPELPSPFAVSRARLRAWLALQEARSLIQREGLSSMMDRERIERGLKFKAQVVRNRPDDPIESLELAQLYAWFDRQQEHAQLCREALTRARDSTDATTCDCAAKSYLIRPTGDPSLLAQAIAAARESLELQDNEWHQLVCGMAEYRAGNYTQAEACLTKAQASARAEVRGPALLFRAMARHAVGQTADAKVDLAAAKPLMKPMPDRTKLTIDMLNANNIVFWLAYEEAQHLLERDDPKEEHRSSGES